MFDLFLKIDKQKCVWINMFVNEQRLVLFVCFMQALRYKMKLEKAHLKLRIANENNAVPPRTKRVVVEFTA